MVLATATPAGAPSARVVLCKAVRDGELVFGTTLESRKGRELVANPAVACVFTWTASGRQVRVSGRARVCEEEETEALWAERGRDSRLVELISREGLRLADPAALHDAFARADAELGEEITRPPAWAAVRIAPETVEFWTAHPRRLSERELWTLSGSGEWDRALLSPELRYAAAGSSSSSTSTSARIFSTPAGSMRPAPKWFTEFAPQATANRRQSVGPAPPKRAATYPATNASPEPTADRLQLLDVDLESAAGALGRRGEAAVGQVMTPASRRSGDLQRRSRGPPARELLARQLLGLGLVRRHHAGPPGRPEHRLALGVDHAVTPGGAAASRAGRRCRVPAPGQRAREHAELGAAGRGSRSGRRAASTLLGGDRRAPLVDLGLLARGRVDHRQVDPRLGAIRMKSVSTDSSCSCSSTRVPVGPPTKPVAITGRPSRLERPGDVDALAARDVCGSRPRGGGGRDGSWAPRRPVDRRVQRHREDHFGRSTRPFPVGFGGRPAREDRNDRVSRTAPPPGGSDALRRSRGPCRRHWRRGWSGWPRGTLPARRPSIDTVAVPSFAPRRIGPVTSRGASTSTSTFWPSRIATFSEWPTTSGSSPPE